MPALARAVSTTPHSAIRTVGQLARSIPGALRLEAGDPDFGTPDHVIAAAAAAARAGYTHYGPSAGIDSLREAAAAKVVERNGFACRPEQVAVTAGACGALYTTLATLVDPGSEVLIPDPGWSTTRRCCTCSARARSATPSTPPGHGRPTSRRWSRSSRPGPAPSW